MCALYQPFNPFYVVDLLKIKFKSPCRLRRSKKYKRNNNSTLQCCNESSVSLHSPQFQIGTFLWAIHKRNEISIKKDFNPYIIQSLDHSMCYCMIHSGISMNFIPYISHSNEFPSSLTGWKILNWHRRIN